jgi:hypothetical protein
VGSAAVVVSSVLDDSGSGGVGCASTTGGVGSGAAGLDAGAAAGAAPGLRRAALGANFLPVVFSDHVSARSVGNGRTRRDSLLMKELVKAAAAGLGACAFSVPAVGGCAEPSSADMFASTLIGGLSRAAASRTFGGERLAWACPWTFDSTLIS